MTPVAAVTLPADSPKVALLRDFPDRLSPMLVKELRQGLKSHVFTWGLIAMQLSLIVMTLISLETGNDNDTNAFFWWSVAGTVCVLLPLRCANALRDESSANTLDTLLLTHLSAWRITLGKWLATCALQALVAMTALPYLILRYFAGGIDLVMEAAWLGVYLIFGMLVSAVMLGLSWLPHFLARAVFMLGVLAGAAGFCGGTIDEISRANNYGLDEMYRELRWYGTLYGMMLTAWVAFFFLDLGAAQLAPISENRATRRRLAALAVLGIGGACCFGNFPDRDTATFMAMFLGMGLVLPAIQALCERPANFAPVLQPFVKRGLPGRLAGRLLYPGWHTGLWFALLLLVVSSGIFTWLLLDMMASRRAMMGGFSFYDDYRVALFLSVTCGCLGILIAPLVLWRLLKGLEKWDFWRWLLVLIAAGAFHLVVSLMASRTSPRMMFANYVLPTGGLFVLPAAEMQTAEALPWEVRDSNEAWELWRRRREAIMAEAFRVQGAVALASLVVWLTAAAMMARREMRVTREAERELG
jgi:hypothetical protein